MKAITGRNSVAPAALPRIFRRRARQALLTFLVVFAGIAAVTFLMPRTYQSRMKILVKNERVDTPITPERNVPGEYRGEVSESAINSEIELLNNENLLEKVVRRVGLNRLQKVRSSADAPMIAIEKAIIALRRNLKISPARKASIIQVDYTSNDPKLSAQVLRELADLYLETHLKVHKRTGAYEFFDAQAKHYLTELNQAAAKLDRFSQHTGIVSYDEQRTSTLQQSSEAAAELMKLEGSVEAERQKIQDIKARLKQLPERMLTHSRNVPNQYSVERLHTMLTDLQNRRIQLLAKFRPEDRAVEEIDQEIASTKSALDKATALIAREESTDVNPVRQTLEIELAKSESALAGLTARRQVLDKQVAGYKQSLATLASAGTPHADLVRSRKEAEANYLLFSQKAEESRISDALDAQKIANVIIVEEPRAAFVPVRPNVPLYLGLGLFLAMVASVTAVSACEHFDDSIVAATELEKITGLPVVAVRQGRAALPAPMEP